MGKKATMEEDKKCETTMTESSLWNKLMIFMTSPADPSNLAVLRIMFGKVVAVYSFLSVHSRILLIWSPVGQWNLATCMVLIIVILGYSSPPPLPLVALGSVATGKPLSVWPCHELCMMKKMAIKYCTLDHELYHGVNGQDKTWSLISIMMFLSFLPVSYFRSYLTACNIPAFSPSLCLKL